MHGAHIEDHRIGADLCLHLFQGFLGGIGNDLDGVHARNKNRRHRPRLLKGGHRAGGHDLDFGRQLLVAKERQLGELRRKEPA